MKFSLDASAHSAKSKASFEKRRLIFQFSEKCARLSTSDAETARNEKFESGRAGRSDFGGY